MTVKVQTGPPQISINQGHTVLITEEDGQINWPSGKGLYFFDTWVVSSWRIYANGEPWELLNGGAITIRHPTFSHQSRRAHRTVREAVGSRHCVADFEPPNTIEIAWSLRSSQ